MRTHRGTVVVVEDDHSVNNAMTRLLKAAGFQARSFTSGEALLADAAINEADCFVIDIKLPGMSGLQVSERLSSTRMCSSIVLITAHDEPEHRVAAMQVGAGYLTKPFSRSAFIDAVLAAMQPRASSGETPKSS